MLGFELPSDNFEQFTIETNYLKSYFALPSQVNYVTETFFVPGYTSEESSHLRVLCSMLSLGQLHKLIREKGGAYGSGARLNDYCGGLTFTTYRDPNTKKSLENFRIAVEEVVDGKISDRDVDEAKLSLFSAYDKPILPQNWGLSQFFYGVSNEVLQAKRGQFLEASKQDLIRVAEELILNKMESGESSKVIFGSEDEALLNELKEEGKKVNPNKTWI